MTDTSGNLNFFSSDVPSNWSSEPSQYTDLNAPAMTPGLFPQSIYPVLNPAALTNTANAQAATQILGVSSDTAAVTMPVAWLYQLQDGTLGPASNGTATNPIVARIAFWADDDTCKININTAGYGTPWNTPRFNTTNDVAWSTNQPVAGEYSEYPGHPATTSLALVFGSAYSPQQLLGLTPRYASGAAPAKMDRLYASLDELCFNTNMTGTPLQRQTNPITPAQLDTARFVLTAHSVAPETTLLGEPRIAIWPVADSTSATGPRMTATDCAITNDATVGEGTTNVRSYFFQRHNADSPTDDLNTNIVPANAQLFYDLAATRGNAVLPGYGTTFAAKYPGAEWTQIAIEIADYIRCINAVDPSPAPFVSYAAGNPTDGVGYGFVDPLTTVYAAGTANQVTLRGMGRCPTLSSLTLVFYVCGFGFKNGTYIDYEQSPDDSLGTNWKTNFLPSSTNWANVTSERIRAFAVPSTFQPGCGYPEVSDACTLQISGLDGVKMSNGTSSTNCGFATAPTSHVLSDALKVSPADRAWGGNEGLLAWRAAALDAQQSGPFTYAFAGTNSFPISLASSPSVSSGELTWPNAKSTALMLNSVTLTASIQDVAGNTLQTLQVSLPTGSAFALPTPVAEYTQDGSGNAVYPSYYMTLKNRVLATGSNRLFMIQPGDTSRSFEAGTDLRVIAGLSSVPATMFPKPFQYTSTSTNVANTHNLHFADGTAVYGASGANALISPATYSSATTSMMWTDWRSTSGSSINYSWPTSAPCSCPTTTTTKSAVTMLPLQNGVPSQNVNGDWDTGPGLAPDGALINLPDSGTTNAPASAYFSLTGGCVGAPTQRTPNALVPSPVIFGSLPAGINPSAPASSVPWRTLLFCPYPAADAAHPGFASPPDHLILDNFWMPVVEPYAISTRMATAGKINLNDQIAPFTYLHRNTALRALLDALRVPAVPATAAITYKTPGSPSTSVFWNSVDEDATVAQIENKFANASVDAYLSESEICTVPIVPQGLVPSGTSVAGAQSTLDGFWNNGNSAGQLTGDNLRELPYAQLYGRLTTRSNSYTVHVRVQVLQKLPNDPQQGVWNEGVDRVLGDWRGSYEIERFLDPAAPAPLAGYPLGPYKFRIVSSRRFAP